MVCLSELGAQLDCKRADFVLKDFDNPLQGLNQLVVIDVIDQLEVELDDSLKAWPEELHSDIVVKQLNQRNCGIHAHRQILVHDVFIEAIEDEVEVFLRLKRENAEFTVYPAGTGPNER